MLGGGCLPLDPADFKIRPHFKCSGWPISIDEIIPFYKRAVEYVDIGKFSYKDEVQKGGEVIEGISKTGVFETKIWRRTAKDESPNFRNKYLSELSFSKTVDVIYNSNLCSFQYDKDRVKLGLFKTINNKRFFIKAKTYILAMGGLESTRILLIEQAKNPKRFKSSWLGKGYSPHINLFHGDLYLKKTTIVRAEYEKTPDGSASIRR